MERWIGAYGGLEEKQDKMLVRGKSLVSVHASNDARLADSLAISVMISLLDAYS